MSFEEVKLTKRKNRPFLLSFEVREAIDKCTMTVRGLSNELYSNLIRRDKLLKELGLDEEKE